MKNVTAKDGVRATLQLRPGADTDGTPIERSATGVMHSFEQDGETRWELVTGPETDPYPAIGFDPETAVLTRPEE